MLSYTGHEESPNGFMNMKKRDESESLIMGITFTRSQHSGTPVGDFGPLLWMVFFTETLETPNEEVFF